MMNQCPLCLNHTNKELFSHENFFISSGVLDNLPNEPKERTKITLKQCLQCGFMFNANFDFEKIKQAYSSQNYVSRKIVSKAMNKTIEKIANNIITQCQKEAIIEGGGA